MTAELLWDVCFNNLHAVELCLTLCFLLHNVVLAEVRDVLRVCQVFLSRVISMELFKVVNLVFVLVVAVVARTVAKVG